MSRGRLQRALSGVRIGEFHRVTSQLYADGQNRRDDLQELLVSNAIDDAIALKETSRIAS